MVRPFSDYFLADAEFFEELNLVKRDYQINIYNFIIKKERKARTEKLFC